MQNKLHNNILFHCLLFSMKFVRMQMEASELYQAIYMADLCLTRVGRQQLQTVVNNSANKPIV